MDMEWDYHDERKLWLILYQNNELKSSGQQFVCSEEVNTNIIGKGQKVKKFNKVKVSSCHWDF